MSPLLLMILAGKRDNTLLHIITDLETMRRMGRLSPGEQMTLNAAWNRLDEITKPA